MWKDVERYCPLTDETLNNNEYILQLFVEKFNPSPWAKLYRRSIFNDNSFPKLPKGQDYLMNFELSSRVRCAIKINKPIYFYLADRDDSAMNSFQTSFAYRKKYNLTLLSIMQKNGLAEKYKSQLTRFALRSMNGLVKYKILIDTDDEWVNNLVIESQDLKRSEAKLSYNEVMTIFSLRYKFMQKVQFYLWILYLKYLTANMRIQKMICK